MNVWMFIDGQKGPEGPNVILISIETTRADHLGCYGYERMTSPVIDTLASEGAMFLNMHVQRGETWPSLTSMMTSLYPVNHGVRHNGHMLPPSKISLAEILKNNKYRCGAFLTNAVYAKWRGFDHKFANAEESEDDVKATQKAIEWLKDQHDKKLFLWIHYWQPHRPYQPPLPYDRIFDPDYTGRLDGSNYQMNEITLKKLDLDDADLNHIISLYDGSILFIDDQIKQVFQTLDDLGIKENSIIIVTADHGEDLYQHNYYFYHSGSVYSSSLHVPFIIKLPHQLRENKKIEDIVQGIDIAPTILDLLDIPIPEHFEGQTLKQLILSESPVTGSGVAYSEWGNKILTIRTDRYRYVYNPTGFHPHPIAEVPEIAYPIEEEELYDVIADPLESANRVSEKSQIAQDLLKKLSSWNHFETWLSSEIDIEQKIPEEVLERLRSLGYIK
jgi:arylsulfatase A-like enzyme